MDIDKIMLEENGNQWEGKLPKKLIDAIARRRCVIMLGSGVSRNSKNESGNSPCTWATFLEKSLSKIKGDTKHIQEHIDLKDYLTACEIIKKKLGKDAYEECLREEFVSARYHHAKIHEHIYNLDVSIVATPNFDSIYETYVKSETKDSVTVRSYYDNDIAKFLLGGQDRLILKTHGTASSSLENLIFSRTDYAKARIEHALFYELLKALALTHVFFFIGCGVDDPDIKLLFEDNKYSHKNLPLHYMTLPQDSVHDDVQHIIEESMRIEFVEYDSSNNHIQLTEMLHYLERQVNQERIELLTSSLW